MPEVAEPGKQMLKNSPVIVETRIKQQRIGGDALVII